MPESDDAKPNSPRRGRPLGSIGSRTDRGDRTAEYARTAKRKRDEHAAARTGAGATAPTATPARTPAGAAAVDRPPQTNRETRIGKGDTVQPEAPAAAAKILPPLETPAPQVVVTEIPPDPLTPTRIYKKKKAPETDVAKESAQTILALLDSLAYTAVGAAGVLNHDEKTVIEPPLTRIIGRMDARTAALVQSISDPLALIVGLGAWGMRLSYIRQTQVEQRRMEQRASANLGPPANPQPFVASGSNGNGHLRDETIATPPDNLVAGLNGEI